MKKLPISKDINVLVRSQEKTFEHDARLSITVDYTEMLDHFPDQDDVIEEEAKKIAGRIQAYLKKIGDITIPDNIQFEGEIVMRMAVYEGHTAQEAVRRLESVVSAIQSEADRAAVKHRDIITQKRMSAITLALGEFKGQRIDDTTIGPIAKGVLTTLKNGRSK